MHDINQIAIRQQRTLKLTPRFHLDLPTAGLMVEHRAGGLLPAQPFRRAAGMGVATGVMQARAIRDLPIIAIRTTQELLIRQVFKREHHRQHEIPMRNRDHRLRLGAAVQ